MLPTEAVEPEAVEPAARTRSIGCQTDDLISYRDFGKLIARKTLFCCFLTDGHTDALLLQTAESALCVRAGEQKKTQILCWCGFACFCQQMGPQKLAKKWEKTIKN